MGIFQNNDGFKVFNWNFEDFDKIQKILKVMKVYKNKRYFLFFKKILFCFLNIFLNFWNKYFESLK